MRGRPTLVVAVTALGLASCGSGSSGAETLPDVDVIRITDGEVISASDLDGPAVVNLWATYCAPCRAEMPAFEQVANDIGDQVRFIGVNEGDDAASAQAFLDEVGVTFDQYLDANGALTDALRVTALPATVVVDADGAVLTVHSGALDEQGIRDLVADHLTAAP
ncbi:MAG: TlpA disulfide reductase family protein [Ilumatobacteraceae bacterium]